MQLIDIFRTKFISSSSVTEQYKSAKRLFRNQMKKLFPDDEIIIGSCPHFEFTGFIKRGEKYVYFASGDLRNCGEGYRDPFLNSMLVRTAKHDKDWTGGCNNFVKYDDDFSERFREKVDSLFNNQLIDVTVVQLEAE